MTESDHQAGCQSTDDRSAEQPAELGEAAVPATDRGCSSAPPGEEPAAPVDAVVEVVDAVEDAQVIEVETPNPERAFERLAEDEALRRDLTDDAFGPLLDLTANLAIARCDRFTSTDGLSTALKSFLGGAADYARGGETVELAAGFGCLLTEGEAIEVWLALGHGDSPETRAASLARLVARATGVEGASA